MTLLVHDVTLTYPDGDGRLTALDHVSLEVPAGTLTAIVGPSGSGKSSLLAVAATLVTPDSGAVVVAGRETTRMGAAEKSALRREKIGIVFQQPNLLASLTAVEQLQVMAHLWAGPPGSCAAGPWSCWTRSASRTRPTSGPTSSRAASASASTSPAR
ncbi:ABC transporter ATP-binding protein YxdL [Streptomyces lavendulae subsp. lavendulae]